MRRLCIAALISLALGACAIGKPVPQPKTYLVEPPAPHEMPAMTRRAEPLRIGRVRVAASYGGNALMYRTADVQFVSDPYNQFISEPGAMLADQIASWLERAGPFRTVSRPESALPTYYVLDAMVTELYGDFRPGSAPQAVLALQLTLLDTTVARPKVLLTRVIERRVDLAAAAPDALVRGYGVALGSILEEFRAALQHAITQ
jgi:cholesterol transport system auxiliary component